MCTEECGRLEPPDESALVDAFRSVTRDAFAFLTPDFDLHPAPLTTYLLENSERLAVAVSEVRYPFLAVMEYTGDNRPVRLSYGRRGYDIELELGANGSGFHPLASWLDALGIEHMPAEDTGVSTAASLARHARRLAHSLRRHYPAIAASDHKVIGRLPSLGARTAASINRTRDRAHAAFGAGDYATFVELMAPFESALTVTERRKLDFARTRRAA